MGTILRGGYIQNSEEEGESKILQAGEPAAPPPPPPPHPPMLYPTPVDRTLAKNRFDADSGSNMQYMY